MSNLIIIGILVAFLIFPNIMYEWDIFEVPEYETCEEFGQIVLEKNQPRITNEYLVNCIYPEVSN